ncbi:MAG: hypothetical protein ACRC37_05795, partial [Lentisphaeria bacterium]
MIKFTSIALMIIISASSSLADVITKSALNPFPEKEIDQVLAIVNDTKISQSDVDAFIRYQLSKVSNEFNEKEFDS